MYSEDRPSPSDQEGFESEAIPMLQRKTVHPDSLKFMDMAKDLLDKPEIKQAIADKEDQE